jgi:DNA ligase-1
MTGLTGRQEDAGTHILPALKNMNAITKPMLASKCERPDLLPFPVLATPKLDGIRCLKLGGKALTRSFKPISNRFAREWIEANLPDGVDGELMLRDGTFSETTSAIGRRDGQPDFVFHIFDHVIGSIDSPYHERMTHLAELPDSVRIVKVLPILICNVAELAAYEEECIVTGYEGVMVRTPHSPYKCGRSTEREAWLLKIKRFEDAEAVVLEPYEGMTNQNAAEQDAFGRTKRSLAQAGMIGRGELGGFIVRHLSTGVEFRLGYNHVVGGIDRVTLWMKRETLIGRVVKFSHQPSGAKEAPRFPKFIGFREAWDM